MNLDFPPNIRFGFPLSRPSVGATIGNGLINISVWGDDCLFLSITRFGFGEETENSEQIDKFGDANCPNFCANLTLRFVEARPVSGVLQADGKLEITLSDGRIVTLECAMDEELAWLEGAPDAQWELLSVQPNHHAAPLEIQIDDGRGWIWEINANESLVTMVRARDQMLFISTAIGETEEAAKAAVSRARGKPDINPIYHWKQFWRTVPRIIWKNASFQDIWNRVLFTQAQTNAAVASPVNLMGTFVNLLLGERDDGIHILPATRSDFSAISFDNIRSADNFIVGANYENGEASEVRIESERGGMLRLHPNAQTRIEREMAAGEIWVWQL